MNDGNRPLEKTVENAIRKHLKSAGIWHFKTHGASFQGAGLPDIIGIVNGRFLGLEVKRDRTCKPTALQKAKISEINRAGGYACVVTSVGEAAAAVIAARHGGEAPRID